MTVKQLIKELTKYDENLSVVTDWHGHPFDIKGVSLDTTFEGLLIGLADEPERDEKQVIVIC